MSLSGSSCEKPDSKGLSPLSRPVLQTGSCELFERFMPKARHPDAGHHRTLLNNKLSSRKGASGRGPSRDLFGARHPAAAGRRSGLAAGLVPVGDPGRQHRAQPPSPPPPRPHILSTERLLAAASLVKWPGRGAVLVRRASITGVAAGLIRRKAGFRAFSFPLKFRFVGLIRRKPSA
jgi:hypothetical protein